MIAQFDGRSAFSSWVYRITLNMVRDMQRASKRRGRRADAYAKLVPDQQPAGQEDAIVAASSGRPCDACPSNSAMPYCWCMRKN